MTTHDLLGVSLTMNVFQALVICLLAATLCALILWPQKVVQFQAWLPRRLRDMGAIQ